MPDPSRKPYNSQSRLKTAAASRDRMLEAARDLFSRDGFDRVTINAIAAHAGVSAASVYAQFKSKTGLLRILMRAAIFSARYQAAAARLDEAADPIEQLRLSATVARALYENEARELGLLRGASVLAPELRELEQAFEAERFETQTARIERLAAAGLLSGRIDDARRILWMYTSRDVYRMMVTDGGWSPDYFERWLADTLEAALVIRRAPDPDA